MELSRQRRATTTAFVVAAGLLLTGSMFGPVAAQDLVPPPPVPAQKPNSGWNAEVAPTDAIGQMSKEDIARRVSDYFNSLKDLSGRFVQTAADDTKMKGKFKLKRPGRFRFDYARPSLQVIISDGRYLAIQDFDLKNEDRISLDQTPFKLLLRKNVDLVRDAKINAAEENDKEVRLNIEDKTKETVGKITVILNKKGDKLEIREWITTDAQGLQTRVEVGNLDDSKELDPKDFVIKAVDLQNFHPN